MIPKLLFNEIPSSLLENSLSFRTVSIQLKVIQALVNIFATVFNKMSVDLWGGVFQTSLMIRLSKNSNQVFLSVTHLISIQTHFCNSFRWIGCWLLRGVFFKQGIDERTCLSHIFLSHFMPHCKQNFRPARSSSLIMTFQLFSSYQDFWKCWNLTKVYFLVRDRTCNTRVTGVVFEFNSLTMPADQIEIHAFLKMRQLGIAALPFNFPVCTLESRIL